MYQSLRPSRTRTLTMIAGISLATMVPCIMIVPVPRMGSGLTPNLRRRRRRSRRDTPMIGLPAPLPRRPRRRRESHSSETQAVTRSLGVTASDGARRPGSTGTCSTRSESLGAAGPDSESLHASDSDWRLGPAIQIIALKCRIISL